MKVWKVPLDEIEAMARALDLVLEHQHQIGVLCRFRLRPRNARSRFARLSIDGRRGVRSVCVHGLERFVGAMWRRGASRVGLDGSMWMRKASQGHAGHQQPVPGCFDCALPSLAARIGACNCAVRGEFEAEVREVSV